MLRPRRGRLSLHSNVRTFDYGMSISARFGTWGVALLLLVVAGGCGSNSFLGQRYDNFTAYYNTFYNARQAYEAGVQAMEGSDMPVDRTRYLPIFGSAARAGGNVSFQSAIEKGADLLRDHPNSKWVDDALLLIGKSYFYQSNFVGAEQKFREVIDLGSELEDESRIWLARTLIASGAFAEARDHLVTSLEAEDVSERWAPRLHLALGELHVRQEAFEEAAQELTTGLEDVRDSEIEAQASFLLGQVLETLGRYEDAVAAYRHVQTAHPRYELSYAANLSAVRVDGLYLGEASALEQLRRMERDGKNYDNRHELAFLRGRIYQAHGRVQEARLLYGQILRDPQAQLEDLRGRLHYALAELYRDAFNDFIIASAHFDTARTALSSLVPPSRAGGSEVQYAPEAITDAPFQADVYRDFADVRIRVARMDSLLELGSLSQEDFDERILEIRRQKAEELAEQQRRAQQLQAERGFQDAASRTAAPGASSSGAASQNTGEAGFLYHLDPVRIQEARMNFVSRWGDRPLVPNWRRSQAVASAASGGAAGPLIGADLEAADAVAETAQLPPVDFSEVPRDSLRRAQMEAERAAARYELANVLFLSMNRPDSAAVWYRLVISEDAEEDVAQRAFYALAEVQQSLGDSVAATRLYEQVLRDYPDSDFAGRVRDRLGIGEAEPSDSLDTALADYDAAFAQWRRGAYDASLDSMVVVAARHAHTEVAPKAVLAAGRIFLEWADAESLDVFGPLPLTVSDAVIEEAGLWRGAPQDPDSVASATLAPVSSSEPALTEEDELPRRRIEPGSDSLAELRTEESVAPDASTGVMPALPGTFGFDLLMADSTATGPAAKADSAAQDAVYLITLYASVLDNHPETPYAYQASSMLDALEHRRRELKAPNVPADSLLAAVADAGAAGALIARMRVARTPTPEPGGEADTTAATADTTAATADTTAAQADTTAATADTTAAQADRAAAQADATAAQADATTAQADTTVAQADATTAQADRAAEGLPSAAARTDTTSPDPATPTVPISPESADPDPAREANAAPDPPSSTESPFDPGAVPSGEASLRGEGGIRPELGGFTIVLGLDFEREPMAIMVQKQLEHGFRADVVETTVDGTTTYRAAVGHFPTREAAADALDGLREELDGPAQIAPLSAP